MISRKVAVWILACSAISATARAEDCRQLVHGRGACMARNHPELAAKCQEEATKMGLAKGFSTDASGLGNYVKACMPRHLR
jgi:hypothetical protein